MKNQNKAELFIQRKMIATINKLSEGLIDEEEEGGES